MVKRQKRRILISNFSYGGGGSELVAAHICRYLDPLAFEAIACYHQWRGEGGVDLEKYGIEVVGLPRGRRAGADYLSFLKLRQIILDRKIDLVHSHSTDSLADAAICRRLLPGLRHVHTFHYGNYPYYGRKYLLIERLSCSAPDRLIAVGVEQRKAILRTYPIREDRILTIRNGIDEPIEGVDPLLFEKYRRSGKIVIGSICNLIEQKGLFDLLVVAKRLSLQSNRYVFVIAGDGPLRNSLVKKRDDLGLQGVVDFLGRVPSAAARLLPIFDIFFQPSLWEAMSMSILEAMSASKPIVATNVGEAVHMIQHGSSGFLVPPKDIEGMASSLQILATDPLMRLQMGMSGKALVQKAFTVSSMVKQYESLYESILDDSARPTGRKKGAQQE